MNLIKNKNNDKMLRICLLSYRSNPYCGGQGVYVSNLAKALKDLGHHVDVVSGPPNFTLDSNISVYKMPSLDLYNPLNLFRVPTLRELINPINFLEWLSVSTMGFPEPFIFGIRANLFLRKRLLNYDIIHDNQSLSYGIWNISKKIPTIVTIHHPITKDRDIAINSVNSVFEKLKLFRWYSFIGMQKRVSRTISKIITVSDCSKNDISREFKIPINRFRVVYNGIDNDVFSPIFGIKREKGRIIVTNSSDVPLKGLNYLLKAVSHLSITRKISLIIIGVVPNVESNTLSFIRQLGIGDLVRFTGSISTRELVLHYAKAAVAVVPSIYEGFGFPAGEAMACGVPLVSTTGGALPEIVGTSGFLVPPKDYLALSDAISKVLDNPFLAKRMAEASILRIKKKFTWIEAAKKTVEVYREVIN